MTTFVADWVAFRHLRPAILDWSAYDLWFDGDPAITYRQMSERGMSHGNVGRHPVFFLLTCPATIAASRLLQVSKESVVAVFIAAVASLLVATSYVFLRLAHLRRPDSAVFSALVATSSASVFWLTVPETYAFGALTIMLALATVAYTQRLGPLPIWWYVTVSALTLGVTITNWLAGLLMLLLCLPIQRAAKTAACSFVAVFFGSLVQYVLLGSPIFLIPRTAEVEPLKRIIFHPHAGGAFTKLKVLLFHSVVMPQVTVEDTGLLSVQHASPGSGGAWALAALALWICLALLGVWAIGLKGRTSKAAWLAVAFTAAQLVLYTVVGYESFLFSLHVAPLLIALAGTATLTRLRPLALTLAVSLVVIGSANNLQKFMVSADYIKSKYDARTAQAICSGGSR